MIDIKFTFSQPYQFSLSDKEVDFPMGEIAAMENFWSEHGKDIEQVLKDITGLSFMGALIKCYLNSEFCVSDPLSLKIEDVPDMKDNLIHEIIHVLMSQNHYGQTDGWKALMDEYKDEYAATRVHIVVHRIHFLLTQRLFLDRVGNIMSYSTKPRYIKAWKIATEDAEKIDFILGLKS